MDPISDTKSLILNRTYTGKELLFILEGMVELAHFEADDQVIKKNKLRGITDMILNLNELDNSNNLEDGRPSNALLTYHVTANEDSSDLLMKILHISNPTPHSTRNLKMKNLLP